MSKGDPCTRAGCPRKQFARGVCRPHYDELPRLWTKPDQPNYKSMHGKVAYQRGKASEYLCVDCGIIAQEWSYVGGDPEEITEHQGKLVLTFSLDVEFYAPRCVRCHRQHDARLQNKPSPWATLTETQVIEIYNAPGTHRSIAAHYGVNHQTVGKIKNKKIWVWLLKDL